PSVVATTELARSPFVTAWESPRISLRRRSETMRPAGSSAALLMRRPVASRSSRRLRSVCVRARLAWAMIAGMFVLMRAIGVDHARVLEACGPGRPPLRQGRVAQPVEPCGLLVLALDGVVYLFTMDGDARRCVDAQSHLVTSNVDDGQ